LQREADINRTAGLKEVNIQINCFVKRCRREIAIAQGIIAGSFAVRNGIESQIVVIILDGAALDSDNYLLRLPGAI
jgi:hypothetical protein